MDPSRLRAYTLLLVVTIIWAVAGPIIKFTLGGVEPLLFLTYRFGISAVIALIFFLFTGISFPKDKKTLLMLLIYGIFTSSVSLGLLFFGLKETTVLDMTLITLTAPLIISAGGFVFLKEHITLKEKVGMGIALLGTIFTVVEPLILNGGNGLKLTGNILLFLYLISGVIPAILVKKLLRLDIKPLELANSSFILGFLTLVPFALIKYGGGGLVTSISQIPLPYQLGVFYMAIFSGTIAYTLSNKAQKTIEVSEASLFSYLYPLFSAPLAVFWLGEKITPTFIIGAVVIVLGVFLAEFKKR